MRLEPRAGERIDRSKAISFTFAGWKVTGFEGDTIASAAFHTRYTFAPHS